MADKSYDLNDAINQAGNVNVTKRSKNQSLRKTLVSILCIVIAGVLIVPVVVAFLTKTDFNKDVPLTEDISRWTPLNWVVNGYDLKDDQTLRTSLGDWTLKEGVLTNPEMGCLLKLTSVTGDYGGSGGDLENTDAYMQIFAETVGHINDNETVWIDSTSKGSVQMNRGTYTSGGKFNAVTYRHSPENEKVMLAIYECDAEDSRDKLASMAGEDFTELKIAVKPSFFSAF